MSVFFSRDRTRVISRVCRPPERFIMRRSMYVSTDYSREYSCFLGGYSVLPKVYHVLEYVRQRPVLGMTLVLQLLILVLHHACPDSLQ